MSLGERIKEERIRLNMTQEGFATACETNKRQQIKYEKDEQAPGAGYLAGACRLGADVGYLLTGIPVHDISPKELTLLAAFRDASEELQVAALSVLGVRTVASKRSSSKTNVTISDSEIGQNISTTGKVTLKNFTVGVPSRRK